MFVVAFVAAQWPFASFLVYSPLARGPLFNAENFVYWMSPTYEALTRRFDPPRAGVVAVRGARRDRDRSSRRVSSAARTRARSMDDDGFADEASRRLVAFARRADSR